ncbi:LysR family transcriptional regulator [Agrobacterium sp. SOY23]|uniref:LysR family transcriptional regulator n=1 Tax=Agrobacterium sp. SOY23 TaxID=3014555 RepID=UPI0022AF5847|nr:LysR family transcriptional regulator [Agrobacterium sp. SOY23]MCZ4433005.1 LysR family transcriptional regulator [Agrobacterium sp. SOY23]
MGKNNQIASELSWDDVRYFLALSRTGSLSAASRQLGVEHSTVSRRAGQLEAALAVRLFDRLARGWTLTDEGQVLLGRAEAVEQEVLGLRRAAAGIDALTGVVRISAPPVMLAHLVLPGLAGLRSDHPGLRLDLIGERREADLIRAEADIAIRLGRPSEPDLVVQSLGEVAYGLFGLASETTRPEAERIYIGFDDSMPGLPQKQWLDTEASSGQFSLHSNDMATMLHAALGGFGVALLPEFLARYHPQLVPCASVNPPLVRPLFLVMHPDVRRSRRVRLVADRVVEVFRECI